MGGDAAPEEVEQLAIFLREYKAKHIKVGWYSGKNALPKNCALQHFDYIKLGAYNENLGGLNSKNTNQRFYKIANGEMIDMTNWFHKNNNHKPLK